MAQTTGFTLWFTGMAGSGKSTLARYLADRLDAASRVVEILDENHLGGFLSPGASPSKDDRIALTRKLGWGASLVTRHGAVALVAAESPYRDGRDAVRREIPRFIEVFCDCPTDKLIERDTTGLYKKALTGQIPHFTGVTDPYETPQAAEAIVHTDTESVEESARQIFQALVNIGYLRPEDSEKMLGVRLKKKPVVLLMAEPVPLYKPGKAPKIVGVPEKQLREKAAAGKSGKAPKVEAPSKGSEKPEKGKKAAKAPTKESAKAEKASKASPKKAPKPASKTAAKSSAKPSSKKATSKASAKKAPARSPKKPPAKPSKSLAKKSSAKSKPGKGTSKSASKKATKPGKKR